jgi:hypothetical protein
MSAKFMHYVKGVPESGLDNAAFYNLLEGIGEHPKGDTVSAKTLNQLGVAIPLTPTYETYLKMVAEGKRCRTCWEDTTINPCWEHDQSEMRKAMAKARAEMAKGVVS